MSLHLSLIAAVVVVIAPTAARAQFAGVVAAPPRRAVVAPVTPTQARAQRDSARRESMSDMRAWVDSAAGVITVTPRPPGAPGRDRTPAPDTTRTPPDTTRARPPRR